MPPDGPAPGAGPRVPRRRRKPQEAREALLDAAEALLLESGPGALKVIEVARHAGVAQSNLAHHFGGIGDLQIALVQRTVQRLAKEIAAVMEDAEREDLVAPAMVHRVFEAISDRGHARLIAWLLTSNRMTHLAPIGGPINSLSAAVAERLEKIGRPRREAEIVAQRLIYLVALVAIGEGLAGDTAADVLNGPESHEELRDWIANLVSDVARGA